MLKAMISACFVVLFTFTSFTQATFEVSEPYRVVDGPYKNYYTVNNNVYSLKIYRKNVTIQQFNPQTMKEVKRAELQMPERYLVEQITKSNGQHIILYSTFEPETKTTHLFSRTLDLKEMKWTSDENLILTVPKQIFDKHAPYGSTDPKRKFIFNYSPDSSQILARYRVFQEYDPLKNTDTLGIAVFDNSFNKIWNREYALPYMQQQLDIFDYAVNNNSDVFILAKVFGQTYKNYRYSTEERDQTQRLELLVFKAENSDILISRPEFSRPIITNIHFINYYEDNVTITGFYKRNKDASSESFFFWEMDSNGKLVHEEKFPVSIKELDVEERKYASKENRAPLDFKEDDLDGLHLHEILPCKDGGQLLIFEKYYVYPFGHLQSHQIVTVKLDENGYTSWLRYLPKKQTSRWFVDPFSYLHSTENKTHYFLYIDHLGNTEFKHTEDNKLYTENGYGNLTAYILDEETGDLKKEILLNTDNINKMHLAKVKASKIIPLENRQFLFEGYKGKKEDVMVKVNLGS